jgi:hypothetical protein
MPSGQLHPLQRHALERPPANSDPLAVASDGLLLRIVPCRLATKSLGSTPLHPQWVHDKGAASDPKLQRNVAALEARVCACYRCAQEVYLVIPETLA